MKERCVKISDDAQTDLIRLYEYIASKAGHNTAIGYIRRIKTYIQGFDIASKRGSERDDIRPGLRVVGFEKRIAIAFVVNETEVIILRIFYGGQNWVDELEDKH